MKIAMMGSGGVGGYYGARLALSGQEVTFIARGAHAEAMRARGLTLRGDAGEETLKPARVVSTPDQAGVQDLIVVAVKLWDTEQVARSLAPMLGPKTAVVSLQNGVDKDEVLARILGRERVLGGVTYIGAVIAEPGVIALTGKLARVLLGELDGASSPRLTAIHQAFTSASVQCAISDQIRLDTWKKFVFLSSFSGLTALTRMPIGAVRANPATRAFLLDALREAAAVARACGAALDPDFAETQLHNFDSLDAAMLSSMAQDLLRGHRLELPWLSGAVVRHGEEHRVPVPVHRAIHAGLVLHQEGHHA